MIERTRRELKKTSCGGRGATVPDLLRGVGKEEAVKLAGELDGLTLSRLGFGFTSLWLDDALERGRRPPPKLVNSDGEEPMIGEVRFPIVAGAKEKIRQRLHRTGEVIQEDERAVHRSWFRQGSMGCNEPVPCTVRGT